VEEMGMSKPRVVAIVQARMGSTRLPGKVLRSIAGKPLLWHVFHRLKKSRSIDESVLAISNNPIDNPIKEWSANQGIRVFRGSEYNLLERYHFAAKQTEADVIVRVTGDAPLVDPDIIDQLVDVLLEDERIDYTTASPYLKCIHEGFNPFTRRSLNRLMQEASDNPVAREHVTAFFERNPDFARTGYVDIPFEHQFEGARLSVDTPSDIIFMEKIHQELNISAGEIDISNLVKLLKSKPELLEINQHVRQKGAEEICKSIIIRCDGDESIGLGHAYRMLSLAEILRDKYSYAVRFAVQSGPAAITLFEENHFNVDILALNDSEEVSIGKLITEFSPAAMIFDIRSDLSASAITVWRNVGIVCMVYDDASLRRLSASLAIYPPVPQVKKLSWDGFEGKLMVGFKYALLRSQFSKNKSEPQKLIPHIFISMGGADPHNLIFLVSAALSLVRQEFVADIVIGRAFESHRQLSEELHQAPFKYELHHNVEDISSLMITASLGVVTFGMVAYELGALGVPALHIGITPDHVESSSIFAEQGIANNLGLFKTLTESKLANEIEICLLQEKNEPPQKKEDHLDGLGARRVAQILNDEILAVKSN
jgi:spore coat polysaccharide biosynthesis protein SpsF